MRQLLFALPLMLVAVPAAAQPAPASEAAQIPPELADPALADKLTRVSGTLAQALMNLPIGEMEAAIEGRTPTQADRQKRVRDEVGPEGERRLMAEVATSGPACARCSRHLCPRSPPSWARSAGSSRSLSGPSRTFPIRPIRGDNFLTPPVD